MKTSMKSRIATALAACLLLAANEQELAKQELKALEGTWTMAALEVEGNKVAEERLQGSQLVIKDGKYIVMTRGATHETLITLDPTKKPKHIDMVFTEGENKDKVQRGIYELEGDTFKLCRSRDPDFDRPKDFTTSPGTGLFVVTWKRQSK
jgi:uncharacterized protein (TIGR03067 family)